jgi:hypothetical protein
VRVRLDRAASLASGIAIHRRVLHTGATSVRRQGLAEDDPKENALGDAGIDCAAHGITEKRRQRPDEGRCCEAAEVMAQGIRPERMRGCAYVAGRSSEA